MQIEKINENQLEVVLYLEDLRKNHISLHSFMCNSSESQNLFFDILRFANKEVGFSLKNHEVFIEAFSIPTKNSFVLLITRVPKETKLHVSKNKFGLFKASKSFWIKFDVFEDFCSFCSSLKNNLNMKSSLYLLNNFYFLHIKINKIRNYFGVLAMASEFSNCIYNNAFIIDENAKTIAKDCAIETCNKYFV